MSIIIELFLAGITNAVVYALIGYGFCLTWRVSKSFNIAQVAAGLTGAFVCLWIYRSNLPLLLGIVVGLLVAACLGAITERVAINPVRKLRFSAWLLSGLGLSIIITQMLTWWWGSLSQVFPSLLGKTHVINILGAATTSDVMVALGISIAVILIFELILERTMLGRAIKAVAHDRAIAGVMGVNSGFIVTAVFGLASSLSALSIIVQSPITYIDANMSMILMIKGMAVALLGGIDSKRGVLIGALIYGMVESYGGQIVPTGYRDLFAFAFLLIVLLFRPSGLFAKPAIREV